MHHLALGSHGVEALAEFYQSVFSLERRATNVYETGEVRSIWLDLKPGILMIEQTLEKVSHVEGIGAGLFLLAFTGSDSDLDTFGLRLEKFGCEVETNTEKTTYARDPEGNRIALSSYVAL